MTAGEKLAFKVISASTAPVWLAMILAPNARMTQTLVRLATPLYAVPGVTYVGLLATALATGDGSAPRFDDPEGLRDALGSPTAFLAGWTHSSCSTCSSAATYGRPLVTRAEPTACHYC